MQHGDVVRTYADITTASDFEDGIAKFVEWLGTRLRARGYEVEVLLTEGLRRSRAWMLTTLAGLLEARRRRARRGLTKVRNMVRVAALAVRAGLLALALMSSALEAQVSLVPAQHSVYEWLHHQRVLGNIDRFSYEAQPLARGTLSSYLRHLDEQRDRLGDHDRVLLRQFLQELSLEGLQESAANNLFKGEGSIPYRIIKSFKEQKEPHIYAHADSGYAYAIDVFYGQSYLSTEDSVSSFNTVLVEKGLRGFASFYDRIGVHLEVGNLSAQSGNRGLRFNPLYNKTFSVAVEERGNSNYFEATASYQYKALSAHIGHGALRYGAGFGEPLALSRDASKFDWIRLNVDTRLFRYTALHASLASDTQNGKLILGGDTLATRIAPNRWLALHRFEFLPRDGLKFSFSEMIIYSARGTDYAYLNPVSPLFISELDGHDRDNALWLFDATWRVVPGVELYGTVLADDLQGLADLLAGDTGAVDNDRAFDVGVTWALRQGWDFGARFVKIEPFVYTHWQQLNAFEQRGFPLGHSLGPNADRKSLRFRKWLPGRGWLAATLSWTRKGLNPIDAEGDIVENVGGDISQGAGNTGFKFLEGADVQEYRELGIEAVIEPWRGIKISARYELRDITQGTRLPDWDLFDIRLTIGF